MQVTLRSEVVPPDHQQGTGISAHDRKELNSANNLDEFELGFVPGTSRKECSPGSTLMSAQWAMLYLDS